MRNGVETFDSYISSQEYLSPMVYNSIICGLVMTGFIINWLVVDSFGLKIARNYGLGASIVTFLICLGMTILIHSSKSWKISLVGYLILSVMFSFSLSIILVHYTGYLIAKAFVVTAGIIALNTIIAMFLPNTVKSLGKFLFISLIGLLVVELITIFFFPNFLSVLDCIAVGIFSLYYAYDLVKAQELEMTLDSAVDSAAEIYVDIINLFIRLLRLLGKSKD